MRSDHKKIAATGIAAAVLLAAPFIGHWEGTKTVGYADVVGIATSCTGHTGRDAIVGRKYSKSECDSQLAHDLERTANGIAPCIHVDVPRESLAAFVSFSFNAGTAGFCNSGIARKLNAGNLKGACAGLSDWVYAGKPPRRIQGLVNRRNAERALCEKGI